MNRQSSEVMKCSRRACDFKTKSNRGMENHVKSCDRKRSRRGPKSQPSTDGAAHRDPLIPKRFGGSASLVPCDNITPVTRTCSTVANNLNEKEGDDSADLDQDLVTSEEKNPGIFIADSSNQNQLATLEERQKRKKQKTWQEC